MPKNKEVENELEVANNNEIESKETENISSETKTVKKAESKKEETSNDKVNKEKIDEATVIDKIKNFLAKIASMQQEEAKKELAEKKEKEEEKSKDKKDNSEDESADDVVKPKYKIEYYDLPYRYNETVVKVLAQTPKKLFVYWDISDNDREKYIKAFGDDFFYKTYPVLLLYNEDMKYVREIPVNDFANSWYIDINDPKTKYTIQLGRKFKSQPEIVNFAEFEQSNIILQTDYLPFANSNQMEAPNDHVLFETLPRFVTFRNVKTNEEIVKDLRKLMDIFGNNYDVEEFYKNEYKDELTEGMFDMSNPSSGVNSSMFK